MLNKVNVSLSSYQTQLFAPMSEYGFDWISILNSFGSQFKVMAIRIQTNVNDI